MARKCVPFTPFEGEFKRSVVALVSNAGVHPKGGEPFNTEGDSSIRLLSQEVSGGELMATDAHYDTSDANRDINCIFPIDRLRELAREGTIGGISNKHITAGFNKNLKEVYEVTAPKSADEMERSAADLVLLTAG